MVKAYKEFEEIQKLKDEDKQRVWLKDYEGLHFSIGKNSKDLVLWEKEKEKYIYSDKLWEAWYCMDFKGNFLYAHNINKIQRHKKRLVIEFDGEKAPEYLEKVYAKLKELGWGFIRSTHKGKCDYLWVEFTKKLKEKEAEKFLCWVAPEGSEVDLNFASDNRRFPILFAEHWKYPNQRETPIEYFEGEQIDYDKLDLTTQRKTIIRKNIEDYETAKVEPKKELTNEEKDRLKVILGEVYEDIIKILKDYLELKEITYKIIAIWIIGTYFYKEFLTYPYLFFNAMKGSGKSRLLNLIIHLSHNGQLLTSITEAVLFRIAGKGTLGIDEFEGIEKRENQGLREILNASYKRGMKIIRMRKKKTLDGEQQVPEEFEPFSPIVMANIWGLEEVLGDRCITQVLEKSSNPQFTQKVEDYDTNIFIKDVKNRLNFFKNDSLVSLCRYFSDNEVYSKWNKYINEVYTTLYTQTTLTTQTTQTTPITKDFFLEEEKLVSFFNEIRTTGIQGRDLELFFPLFIISRILNEDIFKEMLEIAKEATKEKRQEEMTESKDIQFFEFIAMQDAGWFYKIKELTENFKKFIDYDEQEEQKWLNPKWVGRALRRLNLIIDKKRLGSGREITLNIAKAKEKLKMFK